MTYLRSLCTFAAAIALLLLNALFLPAHAQNLSIDSVSSTDVSCYGGANGTATVVASGGTSPYTYSWSPSGGSAATASGLTAGTYEVTVTDSALSTGKQSITITEPPALTATSSYTNVSWFGGSNGSAAVTVVGGTGSYTYSWSQRVGQMLQRLG